MNRIVFNRILFLLSIAGFLVSGFLTLKYTTHQSIGCGPSGGCDTVAESRWAWGMGFPALQAVPTPALGLVMYGVLVGLGFARAAAISPAMDRRAADAQWALSFLGVLVSGYLTYLEANVIHAWCKWCVGSAIIILLIFLTATAERIRPAPRSVQSEVT